MRVTLGESAASTFNVGIILQFYSHAALEVRQLVSFTSQLVDVLTWI